MLNNSIRELISEYMHCDRWKVWMLSTCTAIERPLRQMRRDIIRDYVLFNDDISYFDEREIRDELLTTEIEYYLSIGMDPCVIS